VGVVFAYAEFARRKVDALLHPATTLWNCRNLRRFFGPIPHLHQLNPARQVLVTLKAG
jgi:hypothetical protein